MAIVEYIGRGIELWPRDVICGPVPQAADGSFVGQILTRADE